MSIADRKAALNLQHVGRNDDHDKGLKRPADRVPEKVTGNEASTVVSRAPPPLPSRTSSSVVSITSKPPVLPPRQPSHSASSTSTADLPSRTVPKSDSWETRSVSAAQDAAGSRGFPLADKTGNMATNMFSAAARSHAATMHNPVNRGPNDPTTKSPNTLNTMRDVASASQQMIGRDNTRKLATGAVNAATTNNGSATSRMFDRAAGQFEGGSNTLNNFRNASAATERTIGKDNAQKLKGHMIGAALDANETPDAPQAPNASRPPLLPTRSSPIVNDSAPRPPLPTRPPLPPKPNASADSTPVKQSGYVQPNANANPVPNQQSGYVPMRRSALDMGFNNKAIAPTQTTTSDNIGIKTLKGAFKKFGGSTTTTQPAPAFNLATKPKYGQQGVPARQPLGYGRHIMPAAMMPAQLRYSLPPVENGRDCLLCRDFSAEDTHASHFPRQSVSSLEQLAHDLTSPFESLTSKARVLFAWCHYNITYNVEAFFSGNLKPSTPASTLSTGLAVCEGYAGLFSNLALHAGLECVTISGHGKGYGIEPLKPGQAVPAFKSNHAWNAVKIDDVDGGWKLIDSCWGAGHIDGQQQWVAKLAGIQFTANNEEFGLRHYPADQSQFYLLDPAAGGPPRPPSYEEYFSTSIEELMKGSEAAKNGFQKASCFSPRDGRIDLTIASAQAPKMRFEIHKICRHWDKIWLQGRQRPFLMCYGNDKDMKWLPFVPISGGPSWFVVLDIDDVRRRCKVGDMLWCLVADKFDGKDAAGLSATQFAEGVGRVSLSTGSIAAWKITSL